MDTETQLEVLVVEDEQDLARLISFNLQAAHFRVRVAHTGHEALKQLRLNAPDLVVLDLMLPDISGKEICRRIAANPTTAHIPIIMATARDSELDRVVGFELGAADYVIKPFSMRELTLRVSAILRRTRTRSADTTIGTGPIVMDLTSWRAKVGGRNVDLTRSEFQLLTTLIQGQGRIFSREALLTLSGATTRTSSTAPSMPTSCACAKNSAPPQDTSRPSVARAIGPFRRSILQSLPKRFTTIIRHHFQVTSPA